MFLITVSSNIFLVFVILSILHKLHMKFYMPFRIHYNILYIIVNTWYINANILYMIVNTLYININILYIILNNPE